MAEDQGQGTRRPATERADELLNRVGWTAGLFASMISMRLSRVAAYAREEAEDMWAEAQSIRRQSGGDLRTTAGNVADTARTKAEEAKEGLKRTIASDGEAQTGGTVTAEAPPEEEPGPEQGAEPDEEAEKIKATSTARQRAEELGVDLRDVEGTGSGGQITTSDVKKKAQAES